MTANQNIIDLIARRYSSPAESLNNIANTVNANVRKNSATDVAIKILEKTEKSDDVQMPNQSPSPTSPSSTMLNKLSPGNIFKNIFTLVILNLIIAQFNS